MDPFVVSSMDLDKKIVFVTDDNAPNLRSRSGSRKSGFATHLGRARRRCLQLRSAPLRSARPLTKSLNGTLTSLRYYIRVTPFHSVEISNSKRTGIRHLPAKGTFKVILKEDVPPHGNFVPGRLVISIKSTEDAAIKIPVIQSDDAGIGTNALWYIPPKHFNRHQFVYSSCLQPCMDFR